MPRVVRQAAVAWEGSLSRGTGTATATSSGTFELPIDLPSRISDKPGTTSPEELIAAAHASCFSMALANGLAKAGNPPERLETSAVVTFVPGTGITKSALSVKAAVPGLDAEAFHAAAEDARKNCPVSQALAGVPEITLDAALDA